MTRETTLRALAILLTLALLASCASTRGSYTTSRDKTGRGAGIGAAAGAVLGAVLGEGEADEILAGAAIGAGIGAGIGAYMDAQEEKLARIPGTTVERVSKDMLLVRFDSDLLFAVDSASLSQSSLASLDEASAVLLEYPKTAVVVQGHTDSSGAEDYNEKLSLRRAKSVETHLVGRGIDQGRVTSLGYGEGHPVASNDTAEGRGLNRRVSLLLKAKAR